ncbi:25070_t:CDS:2 [Gigaspora rosea]|nr:25070_t:CDS:2 [Gigaspora rosea]
MDGDLYIVGESLGKCREKQGLLAIHVIYLFCVGSCVADIAGNGFVKKDCLSTSWLLFHLILVVL